MEKTTASLEEPDVSIYASDEINTRLTPDEKIDFYRQMLRIRHFEDRSLHSYQQGKIAGFLHLYSGQEAIAVGAVSLMGKEDQLITAYRDHGFALALDMGMNECMAELYGKITGCSKGKGGSMHLFAPDKNFWGGHGIVAGQVPLGAGIAFALKYQKIKGCCLCFLGDGATNQGSFYETLNLASLWDLPAVFVIENNGYSMGTKIERHSIGRPLARRAETVDMDWDMCNGHHLYEVRAKIAAAIKRARSESRPTLLEISTYRYRGHSVSDTGLSYRTKGEIEEYRKTKDPITLFYNQLEKEGLIDEKTAKDIDKVTHKEAEDAAKFADDSPNPTTEELTRDVYWEEDHPESNTSEGTIFFE